jgi:hypothetical protein
MPTYRIRPPIPVDALRLNEDIMALRQIKRLLDSIDSLLRRKPLPEANRQTLGENYVK